MKLPQRKVGFVNGTFDIIHPGHIDLLNFAKAQCDHLIVGIDSDQRVQQLKGDHRPVHSAWERRELLINLKAVDEVVIFSGDRELEMLVQQIRPDIMVVGSDYKDKKVIGEQYAKRLEFFERREHYSTTGTIQRIVDRGLLR